LDNYGGVFSDPSLVREMKNLYWKPVMKRAMEAISKANFDMEAIITSALSEVKNSTDWRVCSNAARTVREALVRNIIDALKKLSCKDRESAFAQLRDPGHFVGQTYEPYTLERCAEIVVNKVITDDRRYFLLVSEDEVVLERITSFENSGTMIFRTGPDEYYTHIWHEDLD